MWYGVGSALFSPDTANARVHGDSRRANKPALLACKAKPKDGILIANAVKTGRIQEA
jgi:hypothetical protein